MEPQKQFYDTYKFILGCKVFMGNNDLVEAIGQGSIVGETRAKGCTSNIQMHDVLHVSNLHSNLFSMSKFISRGLNVHFNSVGCKMKAANGEILAVAKFKYNLYRFDTNVVNGAETSSLAHLNQTT